MNWKKRIVSLVLAAVIGVGTFLSSGVEAEAAGVIGKGIDVSKYQGAINWSAVAADGYSFAFIKVGSAKSGLDPYFAANMVGANAAGLKTGVLSLFLCDNGRSGHGGGPVHAGGHRTLYGEYAGCI